MNTLVDWSLAVAYGFGGCTVRGSGDGGSCVSKPKNLSEIDLANFLAAVVLSPFIRRRALDIMSCRTAVLPRPEPITSHLTFLIPSGGEYLRVHTFTIFRKYIDMRQVMHNDRKESIAVPQQLRLKTPVLMDAWSKAVVNADELIKARKDGELGEGIADVTTAAAQFTRVLNFVPVASDVIAVFTHARDIYVYKKWRDEAKIVVDALNKVLEDVNKLKVEIETSSNGVPYMQTSSRTGKYEWKLDKDWDAKPNVLKARSKKLSGQIEVDGSEDFLINQDYMLDMSKVVQKRV